MFDHLIVSSEVRRGRSPRMLAASLLLHGSVLALLLAAPLVFYEQLPVSELLTQLILDPPKVPSPPAPPPVPPPQPDPIRPTSEPRIVRLPDLMAPPPTLIPVAPDGAPALDDVPYLSNVPDSRRWGPSGTGSLASVPEAWATPSKSAPPPPPVTPRKEPKKVSSGVQAARLVRKVAPEYPPLALAARIEGVVSLQVWIDEEGNVTSVDVLSGQHLLREAAVEAVRQWKYSPTILNGEPWPVLANVTVRFTLMR
jgi:periplasmic protein TonB